MPEEASKLIPNKLHFQWIDKPIPEEYLKPIIKLAEQAKKDGFELNLWVDDPKTYRKTLEKLYPNTELLTNIDQLLGIKIRTYDELKPRMLGNNADSFWKEEKGKSGTFWNYVERERIGSKNPAAFVDFFKQEILRQEGGWSVDPDTEFPQINPPFKPKPPQLQPNDPKYSKEQDQYQRDLRIYLKKLKIYNEKQKDSTIQLKPENTKYGIKVNTIMTEFKTIHLSTSEIEITSWRMSNDIIGAIPNHPVIQNTLLNMLEYYKKLESTIYPEDHKSMLDFNVRDDATEMDVKRYPYGDSTSPYILNKRSMTIMAGPDSLAKAINEYWLKLKSHSYEEFQDLTIVGPNFKSTISGIEVQTNSHQTWLHHKKKDGPHSYDDANIKSRIPDNIDENETTKLKK